MKSGRLRLHAESAAATAEYVRVPAGRPSRTTTTSVATDVTVRRYHRSASKQMMKVSRYKLSGSNPQERHDRHVLADLIRDGQQAHRAERRQQQPQQEVHDR